MISIERTYSKYSDSDSKFSEDWQQKYPSGWAELPIKYYVSLVNDKTDLSATDLPYLGLEHIQSWTGKRLIDEDVKAEGILNLFKNGDVLFGKLRPYLAKVYACEFDGLCSTEALVLRSGPMVYSKFLFYYLLNRKTISIIDSSSYGTKMPRASWEFIGKLKIFLPSKEEQILIASFLDKKTSQIDKLIDQKEKLLKLLAEKRNVIITQAVTKGLNPDVEMKDSGIDWLGEIPNKWSKKKLKFIASSNDEKLSDKEDPDFELNYVEIGNVDLINGITLIEKLKFEVAPSRARRIARKNDLIISTVRTYLKSIAFIGDNIENLIVSTGFSVLRSRDVGVFLPKYLGYCAQDQKFIEKIVSESVGVSYPAINPWKIAEISVVYPDIEEQNMIVEFLDNKLNQQDKVKIKIASSVEKLKEYREALITSAVTGQIDVRKEVRNG